MPTMKGTASGYTFQNKLPRTVCEQVVNVKFSKSAISGLRDFYFEAKIYKSYDLQTFRYGTNAHAPSQQLSANFTVFLTLPFIT